MLTIHQLIIRMKRCNPTTKCGVEFNESDVTLWWDYSLTQQYTLNFTEHQLTVACNKFQRAMKQAEKDMKGGGIN